MHPVSQATQQRQLLTHALTAGALELYHPKAVPTLLWSLDSRLSPPICSLVTALGSPPSIQVDLASI